MGRLAVDSVATSSADFQALVEHIARPARPGIQRPASSVVFLSVALSANTSSLPSIAGGLKKANIHAGSTDLPGNPEYFARTLLRIWSGSLFGRHTAAANPDANGAPARWEPKKTQVFAVGVLAYPGGQAWPEQGRRDADMIEQLLARGVPADQITFMTDQNATLAAVRQSFDAVMAAAAADTTLWLYFAGHGTRRDSGVSEFMLYDGGWPVPEVFSTIERRFPGSTALLFADCCYSGSLGMEAMLRAGRVSYGALTSSLACTVSTGAWTFTECLIAGLRGMIPVSADGHGLITFAELARFAEREMAFNDGQLSTFVSANGFDPGLVLASGIKRTHPLIGEYVEAKWRDGNWYPGRIERVDGSTFWVRWIGFKESENEEVQESDIRPFVPQHYASGTAVDAEWQGAWHPAEVLTGRWGMHLVHYDNFESVWDEWVSSRRIRLK